MGPQPRLDTVLGKVVAILEAFGPEDQGVPLSEVCAVVVPSFALARYR